jgi:hypothetical protein
MYSDLALELVYYPANNEYPNVNFFTSSMQEQVDAILLTKAKHWEYEREWRIIDTSGPGLHEIQPEWTDRIDLRLRNTIRSSRRD